jgi:ABC-2 type transport system permease protein
MAGVRAMQMTRPAITEPRWILRGALPLAERDLLLIRRGIPDLLLRGLVQPLLFVFVFTYIYPHIGAHLTPSQGHLQVSTIVLPGIIGFSALFSGIFAVGMPLAVDLGLTREIDDRAMAPIPTGMIPLVRLLSGACQAVATALIVPLMIHLIAVQRPDTAGWSPALFVVALTACGLCTAAIGLLVAGVVPIANLPSVLTVIHLPLTFLGAGYYPWASLATIPVLKYAILANPMTYASEALRAAVTPQVPHMNPAISIPATFVWAVVMAVIGGRGIVRQIRNQNTEI